MILSLTLCPLIWTIAAPVDGPAGHASGLTLTPLTSATWAPQEETTRKEETEEDEGGLWPRRALVNLLILRWSEEVIDRYELNEEQSAKLRTNMREGWGRFMTDNEKLLKPLINDYLEMRMGMEAPAKEQVMEWSKNAEKALDLFDERIKQGAQDMRALLTPEQLATFEGDLLGFTTGLKVARVKLHQWKQGEFTEQEFWDPPRAVRDQRRREREEAAAQARAAEAQAKAADAKNDAPEPAGEDAPIDHVAAETDAWRVYVENFIQEYDLDKSQQKTAFSILTELRERALKYRDAMKYDIDKLERLIARHDGSEEEYAVIEKESTRIYGPIDEMFAQLQKRLEPIPTAQQKALAEKKRQEKRRDEETPRGKS